MCCAALAHQNDFDVCWTKGSVAELIFTPLVWSLHMRTAFCNTATTACQHGDGHLVVQRGNWV